jgi:tRNA pseudouridine13 synthase
MGPERRPLALIPSELEWSLSEQDREGFLDLSFTLTPGQYATTMLSSVVTLLSGS